ncbi:MAG: flagellar hook-basal body complex protein, partial [Lachnospiraceae bacterium]|nr:flagellar hook-basal body complex protein [Lachnospiraceae bacterium]
GEVSEGTKAPYVLWSPYTRTLSYTQNDTNCVLQFNTADGTFSNIKDINYDENGNPYGTIAKQYADGADFATLKLEALREIGQYAAQGYETRGQGTTFKDGLRDINIDFSRTENYMNGGNSTVGADRGMVTDSTAKAGKALGALTGVSVSQNGQIYGSYDNGNTVLLGQIAVAQFANASGLESLGDNCYGTTLNSGEFDGIGVDITSDGGSMSTGQLEMSNVDLATEFTDMITTQRGFQANSRIITVSDNMLEELTNLKR